MAVDPRFDGVTVAQGDPVAVLSQQVRDLRRDLASLQRVATVQVSAGPPSQAARDGTLVVDTTNHRLYVRDSGTWRFAATT